MNMGIFVEHAMGTYGTDFLENPKLLGQSTHSSKDDNYSAKDNKSFAMTLTWSES